MKDEILKHIQALSNSKLQQINALETFAKCFNSIYGECAFISLEICPHTGLCQIRLVFRTDAQAKSHFENYIDDEHYLENQQLMEIIEQGRPQIITDIHTKLVAALTLYSLPAKSMMAIPIYLDGVIARWVLVLGSQAEQFIDVDLEQAILLANLAGTYMARMDETEALARANAWIEKELDDIARIQRLLLPQEHLPLAGTQYAFLFEACDKAGGDYFDIVNLSAVFPDDYPNDGADVWGAIIADASGHGAAAAVEVAMFDAILRTYHGSVEEGPANVFNYTNRYFFTRKLRGSFITALILNYDPHTSTLIYANAGHPPAMLLTPQGELRYLEHEMDIPLGVQPDWQWHNVQVAIEPGTMIVAYTDGIIEAMSPQKEQFGIQRLENIIKQYNNGSVQECVEQVHQALNDHQAQMPRSDDQALLVFRIG